MSNWKHKRYFKMYTSSAADTLVTHSGTAEETWNGWSMPAVWNTNSPTKSYSLEDSNQTLVVTFEFASEDDQTSFKSAIDSAYDAGTAFPQLYIKHTKTEWIDDADSVGTTTNDITTW
jgi:hypothetical protein